MDKNYIVHGTLNDYIDYARLIEQQAKETSFKMRVVDSRPSTKRNKKRNTKKFNSHTTHRKILAKKSSIGKTTN